MIRLLPIFLISLLLSAASCTKEDPLLKQQQLLTEAKADIKDGKLDDARIKLQNAIKLNSKSSDCYFQLGEVFLQQKKFDKALESFSAAQDADPKNREAVLRVATLYLLGKQLELADSNIRKLLELDPNDLDALVLRANWERAKSDNVAAKKTLAEVLNRKADYPTALATLGELELAEGRPQKTEELFRKVLEIDPSNNPVRFALGDLYIRQGRMDEAEQVISALVKAEPTNPGLRYFFGEFLLGRGLGERAVEQYQETIRSQPLKHEARDRLYDMYLTRGQADKSRELTAELEKAYPAESAVVYFKGRDLETQNKPSEALPLFLKSLEGMRDFAPVFRRAGLIELASGNRPVAIEHLNQAIAIDPNDVGARLALAQDAFLRREVSVAKQHVNAVLQKFPRQLGANILRADIALIEGDTEGARRIYQLLTQVFPDSPVGFLKLGLLEERNKNVNAAIENYRKGIAFDRKVFLPATRLAALLAKRDGIDIAVKELNSLASSSQQSKPELEMVTGILMVSGPTTPSGDTLAKAKGLISDALTKRPTLLPGYFALARLDNIEGNYEAAMNRYLEVIKRQPDLLPPRMLLALTLEQLGEKDKAKAEYRALLERSPKFGPAANNLAYLLSESNPPNLNEALRLAQIAREDMPNEPSVADTLGWIYYRQSSPQIALPLIQEAVDLERKQGNGDVNPEILYHLGEVRRANGDHPGAKAAYEEALKSLGNRPELENQIKTSLSLVS